MSRELIDDEDYLKKAYQRFLDKVKVDDKTGCWVWQASTSRGYGNFSCKQKDGRLLILAHQFAWVYHRKIALPSEIYLCHTCDNRLCVNHEHLFIGTSKENHLDAKRKGRLPDQTLTEEEALLILVELIARHRPQVVFEKFKDQMPHLTIKMIYHMSAKRNNSWENLRERAYEIAIGQNPGKEITLNQPNIYQGAPRVDFESKEYLASSYKRLWAKIKIDTQTGCHIWQGRKGGEKECQYGHIGFKGKSVRNPPVCLGILSQQVKGRRNGITSL